MVIRLLTGGSGDKSERLPENQPAQATCPMDKGKRVKSRFPHVSHTCRYETEGERGRGERGGESGSLTLRNYAKSREIPV